MPWSTHSLVFALIFLLVGSVDALSYSNPYSGLVRRQAAPYAGPTSFQVAETTDTPSGQATEMCTVQFTPVVDEAGNNQVQAVQSCSVVVSPSVGAPATSAAVATSSAAASVVPFPTMVTSANSAPSPTTTLVVPPASSAPVPANAAPPAVSVNGVTSVPIPSASSASAQTSSASVATTIPGNPIPTATVSVVPQSGINSAPPSSTTDTASAAADNSSSSASASATPFVLPGKKLQVLPIGLGIFAGITVIALIVVGLVTWERTKYRRAFRARKLAEQGAPMGNGGVPDMSERV